MTIPFREVVRFIGRSGRRVAVTAVGFALVAAGLAMLVLPGPGILVVIAGLAVLASEYAWARSLLDRAKEQARRARRRISRRGKGQPAEGPPEEPPAASDSGPLP
ncbi:MAG TPA: PGPGW domain-containing protein [Actinomycetota bacterium]|nr:PGPGW domain-containing protein [Actinomycetota bacterium]